MHELLQTKHYDTAESAERLLKAGRPMVTSCLQSGFELLHVNLYYTGDS